MLFDLGEMDFNRCYDLITGVVVPRPVFIITTLGENGGVNAAPFSFCNIVCPFPPILGLAVGRRGGRKKDTEVNIGRRGQFVVNLADERLAGKLMITAIDFPPEISEVEASGLTAAPSARVAVPRIAESPAALECTLYRQEEIGRGENVYGFIMGEVLAVHLRDDLWSEGRVDSVGMKPLGRLAGEYFLKAGDNFKMQSVSLEEWRSRGAVSDGQA